MVWPLHGATEKEVLNKLLDGMDDFTYPAGQTISVTAGQITCKAGNVDINAHACDLNFGKDVAALKGRAARELYATLAEIGVPPDGAAGSVFEVVSKLACSIDPSEVIKNTGGGAHCDYTVPPED